jgi:hypothetical protein
MLIKKGKYVVVLEDDAYSNSWKDYCFKQKEDKHNEIYPVACPNHPRSNSAESYCVKTSMWRYATDEEIERYDNEGFFKITDNPKPIKIKKPTVSKVINYYEIF